MQVINKNIFTHWSTLRSDSFVFHYVDTPYGVGSAAIIGYQTSKAFLPRKASVFSAELHTLSAALQLAKSSLHTRIIIFSVSLISLRAISNIHSSHVVVRRIIYEASSSLIHQNKTIEFCWVPSHVGIKGNEKADADIAASGQEENVSLYYKDLFSCCQYSNI